MASDSPISLIVNPASGRGRALRYAARLQAALVARGLEHQVFATARRGDVRVLAERAAGRDGGWVVVVGGDGSVQEAAQALAGRDAALAVAPAGRCNDFASYLGPLLSPKDLAAALAAGQSRKVDLVRAQGQGFDRIYCTVGAIGFDAQVSRFVDNLKGPLKGQSAYLYGVLRVLAGYNPPPARLTWDGGGWEGPFLLAAAANTPTYGNRIPIAPAARAEDGLLDLCLVRTAGFWRVLSVLPLLLMGRHGRLPEVSFARTRRLVVEAQGLELWADGEPVGWSPLAIEALPAALNVLAY